MKRHIYKIAVVLAALTVTMGSCSDMLDTSSDMVEFEEDNKLNSAQDSLYSVMGIIRQMQTIADRTVLLGEVRADLLQVMPHATTDIKRMANSDFGQANSYNKISDYYAVINNCNYFLAHADTTLQKLGHRIFEKEYAAVKTYRAWTYLQLAKVYGQVPLITEPVMTEQQAETAMQKPKADINAICDYFINDIKPYVDTELPQYGEINGMPSRNFFIPVRVLLGEMSLWAGRYQDACEYLSQYLTDRDAPHPTYNNAARWFLNDNLDFTSGSVNGSSFVRSISSPTTENISFIPMETSEFDGIKSGLTDVYESTLNNDYYYQVSPSKAMLSLSESQNYVVQHKNTETDIDTIYAPKTGLKKYMAGDLRLYSSVTERQVNRNETSRFSPSMQTVGKLSDNFVGMYRIQRVYLLFAEALCRAGYPSSAFCILKYGLRNQNINRYVNSKEREALGNILNFDDEIFAEGSTLGIHARGCGDVDCDTTYCLPEPEKALDSYADTVQYQIPAVEDMIVREMALETAFEGNRFYDLMRVALRRDDPAYLAGPVSRRDGQRDETLYGKLMDASNWFLPEQGADR